MKNQLAGICILIVLMFNNYIINSQTWEPKNVSLGGWDAITRTTMFVDSDTTLYMGLLNSPYIKYAKRDAVMPFTDDNNGLPTNLASGIRPTDIRRMGDTLFMGFADNLNNGSFWVKPVVGGTWAQRHNGLTNTAIKCVEVIGNAVFVGTNGGVFRSLNNGLNWTNVKLTIAGSSSSSSIGDMDVYNDTLYIAGGKRLAYSADLGNTWVDGQQNSATSIKCIAAYKSTVYLQFASSAGVMKTTNGGNTYSAAWTLPNNNDVQRILVHDNLFFYQQQGIIPNYSGFFYSKDNGLTFDSLATGISYTTDVHCHNMTKTHDGILAFWVSDASINGGVYKLKYSDLTSIPTNNNILNSQKLDLTVIPNPANQSIQIKGVDFNEGARIKIISIDGKVTKDEVIQESLINVSELTEGMYFVELTSKEGKSAVTKFIKN